LQTICSRTTWSSVAVLLALAAGVAHAQEAGPFVFATQSQARAVLGAQDDYVRATAGLERSALLRTPEPVGAERFAAAMAQTARGWTAEEQAAFADLPGRLQRFISGMRWNSPSPILIVKASSDLMEGFPHTRGNAIVLQESMLLEAGTQPDMLAYLMAHEAFHVLSRANPALREELYRALGFKPCDAVDMPAALARLRVTNPDAPESRHAIALRWKGQAVEVLPYVHLPSEAVDPRAGLAAQMRTSWLPVDRQDGRCTVRAERPELGELEGLYEQVGRNTEYLIHPEEILAENFAVLFQKPRKLASPEVLGRIRRILERR